MAPFHHPRRESSLYSRTMLADMVSPTSASSILWLTIPTHQVTTGRNHHFPTTANSSLIVLHQYHVYALVSRHYLGSHQPMRAPPAHLQLETLRQFHSNPISFTLSSFSQKGILAVVVDAQTNSSITFPYNGYTLYQLVTKP